MAKAPKKSGFACVHCGCTSFEQGKLTGEGNVRFKSAKGGFFEKHTVFGGEDVSARCC